MATTDNKKTTTIKQVFGNVLRLAIPLTLRTITLEDGDIVATDTDYTPSSNYPVTVEFSNGPKKYTFDATMRDGNVAVVEDKGTIPIGNYAITVCCNDDNGDPRRFKQKSSLHVYDLTACAGIEPGIEFDGTEWYLDAAIFIAVKGEDGADGTNGVDGADGTGIADISTSESSVSGEYNSVTFTLTDGRSYTLHVRNGESTEQTLPYGVITDINYVHTDNNYTDADKARVNKIDGIESYTFGRVSYDSNAKRINFYSSPDTEQETVIGYIDATPFVIDGMLDNVRIVNDNFVFTFNTESGKTPIYIPVSMIFDRNNYYTAGQINAIFNNYYNKSSVDAMFNGYYNKSTVDNKLSQKADVSELSNKVNRSELSGYAQLDATTGRLKYSQASSVILDFIDGIGGIHEAGYNTIYGATNGHIKIVGQFSEETDLGINADIVFLNADDDLWYRFDDGEWVQVGGSGDSGYNVTYSNGNLIFGSGSSEPTYSNGNLIL